MNVDMVALELKYKILECLSGNTHTLRSLALASRRWLAPAQVVLYRRVRVDISNNRNIDNEAVESATRHFNSYPHLTALVRRLTIAGSSLKGDTSWVVRGEVVVLADLLPRLDALALEHCRVLGGLNFNHPAFRLDGRPGLNRSPAPRIRPVCEVTLLSINVDHIDIWTLLAWAQSTTARIKDLRVVNCFSFESSHPSAREIAAECTRLRPFYDISFKNLRSLEFAGDTCTNWDGLPVLDDEPGESGYMWPGEFFAALPTASLTSLTLTINLNVFENHCLQEICQVLRERGQSLVDLHLDFRSRFQTEDGEPNAAFYLQEWFGDDNGPGDIGTMPESWTLLPPLPTASPNLKSLTLTLFLLKEPNPHRAETECIFPWRYVLRWLATCQPSPSLKELAVNMDVALGDPSYYRATSASQDPDSTFTVEQTTARWIAWRKLGEALEALDGLEEIRFLPCTVQGTPTRQDQSRFSTMASGTELGGYQSMGSEGVERVMSGFPDLVMRQMNSSRVRNLLRFE